MREVDHHMNTVAARKFLEDAKDMLRNSGCDVLNENIVIAMLSLPHAQANSHLPRVVATLMSSYECADLWNSKDEINIVVGAEAVHVFCGKSAEEIIARLRMNDPTAALMYEETVLGAGIGRADVPVMSIFYSDHVATYSLRIDRSARRTAMSNSIAPMMQDVYAAFEGRVSGMTAQSAIIGSVTLKSGEATASVSSLLPVEAAVDLVAINEYAPDFALESEKRFANFGHCVGIVVVEDQDRETKEIFFYDFVEAVVEGQRLVFPDLTDESLVFLPSAVEKN